MPVQMLSPEMEHIVPMDLAIEQLARISHRESRKGNFSRFFDAALGQSRS